MKILDYLFEIEENNPNDYDLGKEMRTYIIDMRGKIKEIEDDIKSLLIFNENDFLYPLSSKNIEQCKNLLYCIVIRGISKPKVTPNLTRPITLERDFEDPILEVQIEYSQRYNIFRKEKNGNIIDEKLLLSSDVNEVCDSIEKIIKKIG